MKKSEMKRELILNTVSQIIQEDGVERVTLEAVAHKAGISKGGLLYHFPSKEALILGMVKHLTDRYESGFRKMAEESQRIKGAWTNAYIDATFSDEGLENKLYTALSAAQFTNPQMLTRLRQLYDEIQNKIEHDEIDPVQATIIRFAVDGLWFAEVFGLAPPDAALKRKVIAALKRSIQEAE